MTAPDRSVKIEPNPFAGRKPSTYEFCTSIYRDTLRRQLKFFPCIHYGFIHYK